MLVVVVDLVVVVGSEDGVDLVVVVVELVSVPGSKLVTIVVDLVASEPGVVLVLRNKSLKFYSLPYNQTAAAHPRSRAAGYARRRRIKMENGS